MIAVHTVARRLHSLYARLKDAARRLRFDGEGRAKDERDGRDEEYRKLWAKIFQG